MVLAAVLSVSLASIALSRREKRSRGADVQLTSLKQRARDVQKSSIAAEKAAKEAQAVAAFANAR